MTPGMNHSVVGGFAGDEGKGKITDLFAGSVQAVVRAEGGANAGHTIRVGDDEFIGHLLPSGAAAGTLCASGRGVRLDIAQFLTEIAEFSNTFGFDPKVLIDDGAFLNFQWHKALEYFCERAKGSLRAYTTMCGMCASGGTIGFRVNPRLAMLYDEAEISAWLEVFYKTFEPIFADPMFKEAGFTDLAGKLKTPAEMLVELMELAGKIKQYIGDVRGQLYDIWQSGGSILFEGAQGLMLDPYWGTYGYNTQGVCTFAGLAVGTGFPVSALGIKHVVLKAIFTRVGNGPFPTELGEYAVTDKEQKTPDVELAGWLVERLAKIRVGKASDQEIGEYFRKMSKEYGATSGRPRRTGWPDLAWAKYMADVNGPDLIVLTKLDCLTGPKTIKVCTGYEIEKPGGWETLREGRIPSLSSHFAKVRPVYTNLLN